MARCWPALRKAAEGLARPIGAVAEDLESGVFAGQAASAGLAVGGVSRGEGGGGHEAGLGLDGDVGLVAVAVLRAGLVHVAGFGIDRRDHPVRGHLLGDLPGPVVVLFDVLAGHQGQQTEGRGGLSLWRSSSKAASRARASLTRPSTSAALATGSSQAMRGLPAAS